MGDVKNQPHHFSEKFKIKVFKDDSFRENVRLISTLSQPFQKIIMFKKISFYVFLRDGQLWVHCTTLVLLPYSSHRQPISKGRRLTHWINYCRLLIINYFLKKIYNSIH